MKLGKLVVFENSKGCSYCKKFNAVLASSEVRAWLAKCGAQTVYADIATDAKAYAALKKQYGFSGNYPGVFVVSGDGKTLGKFVARNYSAKKLIAAAEALCPGCCDDGACADGQVCPTCKGTGRVAAACLALIAAFCAACSTVNIGVGECAAVSDDASVGMASTQTESVASPSNAVYRTKGKASVIVNVNMNAQKDIRPDTTATFPLK